MTTIPLAPPLLAGSSDRPGDLDGPSNQRSSAGRLPIWSCSVRGFACHPCYHGRGALLPHLFTLTLRLGPHSRANLASGRYFFCAAFLQVALTGRCPAHCPAEFGLSSPQLGPKNRVERWSSGSLRSVDCTSSWRHRGIGGKLDRPAVG